MRVRLGDGLAERHRLGAIPCGHLVWIQILDRFRQGHNATVPALDMGVDRALRRDGQIVEIVSLKECTVGRPMVLIFNLCVPGVLFSTRSTTDVQSIEPVADGTDELRLMLSRLPGDE
jgi:hypothetical protein